LAIDCPPGPSEIVVIADETAPAAFVAADLLSQAEHGEDSAAILLTPSAQLAHQVAATVAEQLPLLPTAERIRASLERYGMILIVEDLDACIRFTNEYAPEHLEIMTADPWAVSAGIMNAGSVFLGNYSPVTMGDYLSGTNHVIPTGGYARAFSPLSVDEFVKKLEVQTLTPQGLQALQRPLRALTTAEGFAAHQYAVDVRLT
jgi:histidinol dehydrogenase